MDRSLLVRQERLCKGDTSMTDNNRKPEQQQNTPSQQTPGQQNQQGEPKGGAPGRNPGGQADQGDPAHAAKHDAKAEPTNVKRGDH
jgi:hypothetical protein